MGALLDGVAHLSRFCGKTQVGNLSSAFGGVANVSAKAGKTHLASALAFSACAQGHKVCFHTVTGLVTELLECREERRLQRFHLLILDELGYVPFSKTGAELLFEVISRSYGHHSLMVTSNLPFEEWTEVFGSERLTVALLDRLTHKCHILEANGESFRLQQAKKRSGRRASPGKNSTPQKTD